MDEFKDINWKDIQKIVSEYTGDVSNEASGDRNITPILAHSNYHPTQLTSYAYSHLYDLLDEADGTYSYVSSLIKKNGRYIVKSQGFLCSYFGDIPILDTTRDFKLDSLLKVNVMEALLLPLKSFQRNKHLKIITFKDSQMKQEDFDNIIEIWRTEPL